MPCYNDASKLHTLSSLGSRNGFTWQIWNAYIHIYDLHLVSYFVYETRLASQNILVLESAKTRKKYSPNLSRQTTVQRGEERRFTKDNQVDQVAVISVAQMVNTAIFYSHSLTPSSLACMERRKLSNPKPCRPKECRNPDTNYTTMVRASYLNRDPTTVQFAVVDWLFILYVGHYIVGDASWRRSLPATLHCSVTRLQII
jgi:hypothetical protein